MKPLVWFSLLHPVVVSTLGRDQPLVGLKPGSVVRHVVKSSSKPGAQ